VTAAEGASGVGGDGASLDIMAFLEFEFFWSQEEEFCSRNKEECKIVNVS
jgi:hypothetical protein